MTRLSDLLGSSVRTKSGRRLGRVHDVRAELRPRTVVVTGLVIGRVGVLERLGVGAPESKGRNLRRDVVPWRSVISVDRRGVVIRDEAAP